MARPPSYCKCTSLKNSKHLFEKLSETLIFSWEKSPKTYTINVKNVSIQLDSYICSDLTTIK